MRTVLRWALGVFMLFAGTSHLRSPDAFLGQVPAWIPMRAPIIWVSGVIEIGLGLAVLLTRGARRRTAGRALAIFLVGVFPGNLYQAIAGTDAFGLDTPVKRWGRLLVQPVLVAAALWSTGAWPGRRERADH